MRHDLCENWAHRRPREQPNDRHRSSAGLQNAYVPFHVSALDGGFEAAAKVIEFVAARK